MNLAIETYGTAAIFEARAARLRTSSQILDFTGLAVPILVGAVILSFGVGFVYLPILLGLVGVLSIVQLIWTLWSLVARWDDQLVYAQESASDNHRLSRSFADLAGKEPHSEGFTLRYSILDAENSARSNADYQRGITEQEKRYGMCAGLRKYQRACVACGKTPTTMAATTCSVCGNF